MKISYNWLKEFVDINVTPEKLSEVLTMHSFEVENIIYQGEGLDGVVVGEVLEIKKHPNADKLSIAKVDVGEKEPRQIIFGQMAKMEIGLKVPVALAPTILPGNKKIEKSKLRGELSEGMLCLDQELELLKEGVSITFFDKDIKNGTPIRKALNLDDVIFEIDILPNRAHDCLSHLGVAREVAAITGESIKYQVSSICGCHCEGEARSNPNTTREKLNYGIASPMARNDNDSVLNIKIEDKNLCRRYSAAVVNDVEIKESPAWLKNRLESCGVRPINNVVDITNYVMLSLGQPMHVFDLDKLSETKPKKELSSEASELSSFLDANIIIRNAKKGEKILALDEKEYKLNEDDLVIADENRPIAIAGVMGGIETAVDENTKNIIFESANFQGTGIRKTSQRLKLASESSYRFEREIDSELTIRAIETAVKLAGDLAGGKAEKGIIDIYSNPAKPKEIEFDFKRIKNLLGVEIAEKEVIKILESLDLEAVILPRRSLSSEDCDEKTHKSLQSSTERLQRGEGEEVLKILKITVPTHRIDIEKTNDIIEEVGRIFGYENIPESAPTVEMKSVSQDKILSLEKDIREISEGLGWSEVYNYSFVSEKDIKRVKADVKNHFELENPLSEEYQFMRTSLLSGLLKNASLNLKYKDDFALFEIGRVYLKRCWLHSPHRSGAVESGCEPLAHGLHSSAETMEPTLLPDEKRIFAGVVADKNIKDTLFYELKGKIEVLLSKLGIGGLSFQEIKSTESFWHKGRSSEIVYQNKTIGKIGEIHSIVSNSFDIEKRVLYFEIYEEEMLEFYSKEKNFQKINKFPGIELDLSIVFNENVKWDDVKKAIFSVDNKLIKSIEPFDIYRGKGLGEDKKSIAFRISYQAEDRTLKDEEVGIIQEKVIEGLGKMGGEVRS